MEKCCVWSFSVTFFFFSLKWSLKSMQIMDDRGTYRSRSICCACSVKKMDSDQTRLNQIQNTQGTMKHNNSLENYKFLYGGYFSALFRLEKNARECVIIFQSVWDQSKTFFFNLGLSLRISSCRLNLHRSWSAGFFFKITEMSRHNYFIWIA